MDIVSLLLSGVGGGVLGPIIAKVLGGSMKSGGIGGLLGGLATGVAAQNGVPGIGAINVGYEGIMAHVSSLLQGGVGGGVLGTIAGILMKSKG